MERPVSIANAVDWLERLLWTATVVGAPPVVALVVVGIAFSILQAATQVNDAAVGFAPKVVTIVLVIVVAGEWMLLRVRDFALAALSELAHLGPSG
jgi:flagellar biosynthetic protein FliQ